MQKILCVAAVVSLVAGAPLCASAATTDLGAVANAMLQPSDVPPILGKASGSVFTAKDHPGLFPWGCTTNGKTYLGKTVARQYDSTIWLNPKGSSDLVQHVFDYGTPAAAEAAWKDLSAKLANCKGTSMEGNYDQPGGTKYKVRTSHGTTDEMYGGRAGVWMYLNFEAKAKVEQAPWADDEFSVYYLAGNTIQIADFDRAPNKKMPWKLRDAVEVTGQKTYERWVTAFPEK